MRNRMEKKERRTEMIRFCYWEFSFTVLKKNIDVCVCVCMSASQREKQTCT